MPVSKQPRTDSVVLTVRLTPAERDLLDKWAAEERRNLSSLIRSWIAEKASGAQPDPLVAEHLRAKIEAAEGDGRVRHPGTPPPLVSFGQPTKCDHPRGVRIGDGCPKCGATGLK